MNTPRRECLPLKQVLDTVRTVGADVLKFYDAAAGITSDHEALATFGMLAADLRQSGDRFSAVCESLNCGDSNLTASEADLDFLSVLAESLFYRDAGAIIEPAGPEQRLLKLTENALALERDLLLFHTRFHGFSCDAHRPIFLDLIQRGHKRVSALVTLRQTLLARIR
jgi:hypothetical protein